MPRATHVVADRVEAVEDLVGDRERGVVDEDPAEPLPVAVVDEVAVAAGELVQLEVVGEVHGTYLPVEG